MPRWSPSIDPRTGNSCADLLDQGIVLAAGAYTDGPAGALLVFRGDSEGDIARLLESDPFQQLGLVQDCQIRAWGQAMGPWAG